MKRLALFSFVFAIAVGLSGCIKSNAKLAINPDNTGTVGMKTQVKMEAIENIKHMMESMGGDGSEMSDAFAELESLTDEAKLRAKLEKEGVKVGSIKSSDKDGWKTLEVEASIADVNDAVAKAAKQADKKLADTPMSGMQIAGGPGGLPLPHFYKTATEGVGQAVIVPPMAEMMEGMGGNPMEQLEDLEPEEREQAEMQIEQMKAMFSIDEMSMEITIQLPGKIVATKGCKQVDDRTVSFTLKGGDITIDGVKNLFGMKDGVSATFQIPEGCKINFADMPAKKEKKKEAEEEGGEGEKKEKKGGIKIGEEKKGG